MHDNKPMSKRKPGQTLTDRQRTFCEEYLVDLNAAQAAIRAGYSAKTARVIANETLAKPAVAAYLQQLLAERSQRTQVTADRVITEVARLGFSDVRKLFDPLSGQLLAPSEWPDDVAAAVSSIEVEELMGGTGPDRTQIGWTKKVKLWDKPKSLEMLGRHLKLWVERHEHTGPNGGPIATRNDGVDLKKLTDAELEQLETIIQAAEQRSAGG
jgi:phage terminase small subunit